MDAQRITLDPDPFKPFFISQGFRIGDLILLSGQVGMDDSGNAVGVGDFDAQADQAMRNIQRALQAAGSDVDRIVKVTIYVTDMAYRPNVFALRQRWFKEPYPADTFVAVAALGRPDRLIEIDATALADGRVLA
ncbi:MAG: RidA family protein [Proteobacteria bacterium]|nr:RidA family protein [Pseudomonadota bacterium]MDA1058899.1 RidA family protein [Pseudomonadota bacterium]